MSLARLDFIPTTTHHASHAHQDPFLAILVPVRASNALVEARPIQHRLAATNVTLDSSLPLLEAIACSATRRKLAPTLELALAALVALDLKQTKTPPLASNVHQDFSRMMTGSVLLAHLARSTAILEQTNVSIADVESKRIPLEQVVISVFQEHSLKPTRIVKHVLVTLCLSLLALVVAIHVDLEKRQTQQRAAARRVCRVHTLMMMDLVSLVLWVRLLLTTALESARDVCVVIRPTLPTLVANHAPQELSPPTKDPANRAHLALSRTSPVPARVWIVLRVLSATVHSVCHVPPGHTRRMGLPVYRVLLACTHQSTAPASVSLARVASNPLT